MKNGWQNMGMVNKVIGTVIWVLLAGLMVMLSWNLLATAILGLATVNYWQGIGMFVLCRILFGARIGGKENGSD